MTPAEQATVLRALRSAPYGSTELLDAVEAAMDSGNGLREACEARLARERQITEELRARIPDGQPGEFTERPSQRRWTIRDAERFRGEVLKSWPGLRARSVEIDSEVTHPAGNRGDDHEQ